MSDFYNNSIFWVEVDRISPNPYQPRKDFNDDKIEELADSIRQYGVLQPLVVTRQETERPDGGISVEYELIAGERRLRASKLAGVSQVPVIIRAQEQSNKMKLELAIIENLQREDLNAIDRARAFKQLVDEFNLKHIEIAKKVGKSREYVSNTLRLLGLPEYIQAAVSGGKISEGHARPLLMLGEERAAERDTLFKEITTKKLTVRESERIARRIATDKARKQDLPPELIKIEKGLTESLGTRVQIEKRSENGGKVHIDFFSQEDLQRLLDMLAQHEAQQEQVSKKVQNPQIEPTPTETKTKTVNSATTTAEAVSMSASEALKKFNEVFGQSEHIPQEPKIVPQQEQSQQTQAEITQDTQTSQEAPINPFATVQLIEQQEQEAPEKLPSWGELHLAEQERTGEADTEATQNVTEESGSTEPFNPFAMPAPEDKASSQDTTPDDLYAIKNFSI